MMRMLALLAVLFAAAPALAQQGLPAGADPQNTLVIDTTQGRVYVKLRNDIAPKHAERLKQLARDKFYDNVPFHRVIAGFMAQTGDGQNGNGTGGSKYPDLAAEFSNARRRTLAVTLMSAGYPLGAIVGGSIASGLLVYFKWRAIFTFGGLATAAASSALPAWTSSGARSATEEAR